ncbi:ABC transporter permease [Chryseobacterium wanjuense]
MKKLLTAANVEWLKIKGLGLTYLAVIIGALIPILFFLEKLFITDGVVEERLPYSVFQDAIMQNVQGYMFYLMLIFIIIVASRIAQIDHKNNCWQLMETQPVKRTHIYFSKYIVLLRLSFLCITSFFIFSIILSFANFYIHPEPSKLLTFDVLWMLETYLKVCFTILGIAAFQLCISVAFPGFIWSF